VLLKIEKFARKWIFEIQMIFKLIWIYKSNDIIKSIFKSLLKVNKALLLRRNICMKTEHLWISDFFQSIVNAFAHEIVAYFVLLHQTCNVTTSCIISYTHSTDAINSKISCSRDSLNKKRNTKFSAKWSTVK